MIQRHGETGRYTISTVNGRLDVHQERLKPYLYKIDGTKVSLLYFQPKVEFPEDDTFIVEDILRHRQRHGVDQWLVKWKGYDDTMNTWEPAECFIGAIQKDWVEFNRRHRIPFKLENLF